MDDPTDAKPESPHQPLTSSGRAANGRFDKGNAYAFKQGQSGHPGRLRSETMGKAARAQLRAIVPDGSRTYAEAIALRLARAALRGDVQAARELIDRAEGKPRQSVDFQAETPRTLREYAEEHGLELAELVSESLRLIEEATSDDSACGNSEVESLEPEA